MATHPSDEGSTEQEDVERRDRTASGGDAEAAGSLDERRAVATDEDDVFEDDSDDERSDE